MTATSPGNDIVRSLPFHIPDDVRLYEIKTTSRGSFTRPRKEVQMPLAIAAKQRVHSATRVRYPLLREDWSPEKPKPHMRGHSGYKRICWDQATDIIVGRVEAHPARPTARWSRCSCRPTDTASPATCSRCTSGATTCST